MPEQLAITDAGDVAEVESLSRELAEAYRRRVEFYRREYAEHWGEVLAMSDEARQGEFARRALTDPPDQVSYSALDALAIDDPDATLEAWQRVKQAARDELASGHRAAKAMQFQDGAWQRAQFLAIRDAFLEQWQPQNGGERLLVDMLAQTYASYLDWLTQMQVHLQCEASNQRYHLKERGSYETPRLSTGEAMEQAAAMVDRFNRLFLRTLRQLRDLRRYGQQIVINSPGQVNIGQQQVNASGNVSVE